MDAIPICNRLEKTHFKTADIFDRPTLDAVRKPHAEKMAGMNILRARSQIVREILLTDVGFRLRLLIWLMMLKDGLWQDDRPMPGTTS